MQKSLIKKREKISREAMGSLPLKQQMVGRKGFQRPRGVNRISLARIDAFYMRQALALADEAAQAGEVPIACVLVLRGRVIARGRNRVEEKGDRLAHAEMLCLQEAQEQISTHDLEEATLYVTLEPCPMCAGAILNSRLHRLVYGASDPRMGACGSSMNVLQAGMRFSKIKVSRGVLRKESAQKLSKFFSHLRQIDKFGDQRLN